MNDTYAGLTVKNEIPKGYDAVNSHFYRPQYKKFWL